MATEIKKEDPVDAPEAKDAKGGGRTLKLKRETLRILRCRTGVRAGAPPQSVNTVGTCKTSDGCTVL